MNIGNLISYLLSILPALEASDLSQSEQRALAKDLSDILSLKGVIINEQKKVN